MGISKKLFLHAEEIVRFSQSSQYNLDTVNFTNLFAFKNCNSETRLLVALDRFYRSSNLC